MAIVSVSLPDDLLHRMDATRAEGRSAFIRTAVRRHLQSDVAEPHGHIHGSITVLYPEGHEARISEVRHAFHDVVLSMMHTHCDEDRCMDVLLVGGDGRRIADLQARLEAMRVVDRAALVVA